MSQSGGIYDEGRRGWLYTLEGAKYKAAREAFKQGERNHLQCLAERRACRWTAEQDFQCDKGETNLDEYEIRG